MAMTMTMTWTGNNSVQKTIRNAHEGPVFSLLVLKDGRIVSGGGKDGQLLLWDPTYRRTGYVAEVVRVDHIIILSFNNPIRKKN